MLDIGGGKMNKEQIQAEYLKLLSKRCDEADEIVKKAKENGTWMPGLDSNRDLFLELDKQFKIKIEELKNKLDE